MATTVEPTTSRTSAAPASRAKNAPAWLQDPTKRLVLAGGVVAAIALVGYVAITSGRRKEEFAGRQLDQARAAYEAGNLGLASSDLQKVIQTYRGTEAANEATIALNQVRLTNNQAALAAADLRKFIATKPDPAVTAQAYSLLGAALENTAKPADAADAYRSAAEQAPDDYFRAEMLVAAGRALRDAGKPDEAMKVYREVVQKYAKVPAVTEAQVRLAELTKGKM